MIKIRAASKIFVILDPLTQRDGTSRTAKPIGIEERDVGGGVANTDVYQIIAIL